jgi:hypothetical protein
MRGILSEYGPDAHKPQVAPARSGGVTEAKTLPYSPPVGPSNIGDPKSPGLHGTNHGNCGTQRGC